LRRMAESPFRTWIEVSDVAVAVGGDDGIARGFRDHAKPRLAEPDLLFGLEAMDLMPRKAQRNSAEQREKPGSGHRKVELEGFGLGVGECARRRYHNEPTGLGCGALGTVNVGALIGEVAELVLEQ